jgi:hypothetical protein
MFTKLNRVLLASGLAIGTAALLSPAAFAQSQDTTVLNGTISPVFTLTWTANPTTAFSITPDGTASNVSLGTVSAGGNVLFTVKASSPTGGKLVGQTENNETIDYAVLLASPGGTGLPVTPAVFPGTAITASVNSLASTALTLNTTGSSGILSPQIYTDTLTLTTSAP